MKVFIVAEDRIKRNLNERYFWKINPSLRPFPEELEFNGVPTYCRCNNFLDINRNWVKYVIKRDDLSWETVIRSSMTCINEADKICHIGIKTDFFLEPPTQKDPFNEIELSYAKMLGKPIEKAYLYEGDVFVCTFM